MSTNKEKSMIIDAIRNSEKSKLKYDRDWTDGDIEEIIRNASNYQTTLHPICLPSFSKNQLDRPSQFPPAQRRPRSPETSDDHFHQPLMDPHHVHPIFSDVESKILERENVLRLQAEQSMAGRRRIFATFIGEIYKQAARDEVDCSDLRKLENERRNEERRANLYAEFEEDRLRLQKLKRDDEMRAQLRDERIRAVERQKLLDEEVAAKKIAEQKQRLDEILGVQRHLKALYESIVTLISAFNGAPDLSEEAVKAVNSLKSIKSGMESIVDRCRVEAPTLDDVQRAYNLHRELRNYHDVISDAVSKVKAEAVQQETKNRTPETKPEIEKTAPESTRVTGPTKRYNDKEAAKRYGKLVQTRVSVAESCAQLEQDPQLRKFRFDLKKSVNIPINAISAHSGAQLLEKLDSLTRLINGGTVGSHPAGRAYVLDLIAKKFVTQGEDQVANNHNTAFQIAAVIVGLWKTVPEFGELFLAHVYAKCPLLVPCYVPFLGSGTMGEAETLRSLGYNCVDGVLESEGTFLKRTTGIIRLYAAVIQSALPKGISPPHPHGLGCGWALLSTLINLEPYPNVTAMVISNLLEVCGHSLQTTYKGQFQKLLLLLCKEYFPKIQAVTPDKFTATLSRLESFLQNCLKRGKIPPPDGALPANFWYSR